MTELEKRIYKTALENLPELREKVNNIKTTARYISLPFICDGVMDTIIYDTKKSKFTKIEYTKGKGKGTNTFTSDCSAYFDEVENCSFEICVD